MELGDEGDEEVVASLRYSIRSMMFYIQLENVVSELDWLSGLGYAEMGITNRK